ncbi:MAG: 16S rRNA (uracil(1498)-N(3))-methyltransferase [Clostridia bacterium]|nr:16S rRNA (uracil(1498)-N(3))-methyltransferase [Clostridia bacterium]
MARFFVPQEAVCGNRIHICGEDVNHITKVLRMREGDTLTVCDGCRGDYFCKLVSLDKKEVIAEILEKTENGSEPPCEITLYQGMPKGSKLDYIVQKCVEIGVCRIVPMVTERVVKGGDAKRERLSKIALEAAKQSGRGIVPEIGETLPFSEAVKKAAEADMALFPYECEKENSLKNALRGKTPKTVSVLIGPEGGFSDGERAMAEEGGLLVVTLGSRILRTETAGPVTVGNILYEIEG